MRICGYGGKCGYADMEENADMRIWRKMRICGYLILRNLYAETYIVMLIDDHRIADAQRF